MLVAGLKVCNISATPTQTFPADIAKFLRITIFMQHFRWVLLTVLPRYSKVSWVVWDFARPRAFDFDQKILRNVAQIILYHHATKQFPACLN